MRIIDNSKIV